MIARIRRSPILLGLLGVLVVAALAFGWWTISPFFTRTSLSEGENTSVPASSAGQPMADPTATTDMAQAKPADGMMDKQANTNLGTLKATTGSFNYMLDPAIDATKIKSVVIYCRAFSVLFSTAALQAP